MSNINALLTSILGLKSDLEECVDIKFYMFCDKIEVLGGQKNRKNHAMR